MGYKHMTDSDHNILNGTSGSSALTYNIDNLASQSPSTPSDMREDILLVSWLIVLLRTREGERVSFDWTYQNSSNVSKEPSRHLSMEDVMKGLEDPINDVTRTISDQISRADSSKSYAEPLSLLLSTNVLSQRSEDPTVRCLFTR